MNKKKISEKNSIKISKNFFKTQEWKKNRIFSEIEAILFLILKKEIKISCRNLGKVFNWSKAKVVNFIHKLITKGYIKKRIEDKINVLTFIKFIDISNNKKNFIKKKKYSSSSIKIKTIN